MKTTGMPSLEKVSATIEKAGRTEEVQGNAGHRSEVWQFWLQIRSLGERSEENGIRENQAIFREDM